MNLPDSVTDSADAVKFHCSALAWPVAPVESLVHSLALPPNLAGHAFTGVAVKSPRQPLQEREPQMRVGISGTHGTGKTTLAAALCARLPGHVMAD